MLRVKICGVTRPEDAVAAAALGADAIGLIFHPSSPRYVDIDRARRIVGSLPPWVARVGVFVDREPDDVRETVRSVGLTAVQLHGDEDRAYVDELRLTVPAIKAIRVTTGWQERLTEFVGLPILLDHGRSGTPGGTGERWNWDDFARAARPVYFILAGGLTPENAGEAIARLRPDAVDVATGVEQKPGVKDPDKLRRFFAAVQPFRMPTGNQGS